MMEEVIIQEAFAKYLLQLKKQKNLKVPILEFPANNIDIRFEIFMELYREHSRVLRNELISFSYYVNQLTAWSIVLVEYPQGERVELMFVFSLFPLVSSCLGIPYALKSRFIKSIAQISQQANLLSRKNNLKKTPRKLAKTKYKDAKDFAEGWDSWQSLDKALANLDNTEYRSETNDFRGEYQHGFPQGIEIGVTSNIRWHNGCLSFTSEHPFKIKDILNPLKTQIAIASDMYNKYADLLYEQFSDLFNT